MNVFFHRIGIKENLPADAFVGDVTAFDPGAQSANAWLVAVREDAAESYLLNVEQNRPTRRDGGGGIGCGDGLRNFSCRIHKK